MWALGCGLWALGLAGLLFSTNTYAMSSKPCENILPI